MSKLLNEWHGAAAAKKKIRGDSRGKAYRTPAYLAAVANSQVPQMVAGVGRYSKMKANRVKKAMKHRRHKRHKKVHASLNDMLRLRQVIAEFMRIPVPTYHKGLRRRIDSLESMIRGVAELGPESLWELTQGDIPLVLGVIGLLETSEYNVKKFQTIARAIGGCGISARIVERRSRRNG